MARAVHGPGAERPFVGRDAELRTLVEALTRPTDGRFVLVQGEPGIGKSALIASAVARADTGSGSVLHATADAMDQRRPYGLLLDALASRDTRVSTRVAGLVERGRQGTAPNVARSDVEIGEQVLDLVDVLATREPLVLVLEDLQWADPGSLAALTRLSRTLHQQPVVVVCSRRPLPASPDVDHILVEADARQHLTTIDLGPLGPQECAALVEAVTRARVDDVVLHQLDAAGGNPLFLLEMLGVIQREGSLTVDADGSARLGAMPARQPSLALMIMNHLGSLSAPARHLLVLAAVLGVRFPIADLRLIAAQPMTELMPVLNEVMTAGVLDEDGERMLTFRHALIQEVLIADVPATIRGELHTEIARRLDAVGAPPVSVAEHLLRAPSSAELVPWTLELADRVRSISSDTAVELWRHVVEAVGPEDSSHVRAVSGIARAVVSAGRSAEAAELARGALERRVPAALEGALRTTLCHALLFLGDPVGAQAEADSAAQSPRLSAAERAAHLAFSGWPRLLLGETAQAVARAREAEDAAKAAGNVDAQIFAMILRGHVAACRGELDLAHSVLSEAVSLADGRQTVAAVEAFPHQMAATLLADLDRPVESIGLFERGRRLAERLGYPPGVFTAFQLGSRARALTGHLSDVEADLEARDSLRGRLDLHSEAPVLGTRAWVALHRDGPDAADPWVQRLGDLDAISGLGRGLAWVYGPVGAHALSRGDRRGALEVLWRGWERCVAREMVMDCVLLSVPLVVLAVEAGHHDRVTHVVDVVTAVADGNPDVVHLGATASVVRGLARGETDELLAGANGLATTPRRMAHAQAAELAAAALARDGRVEEGTVTGLSALRSYQEVGADHEVAEARARLAAAGIRLKGHRVVPRPTTGWAALTRTEETVARQVATGLSNPEVAEVLFVSRRTVETHVSHVLAKLGLRSRSELVLFVSRRAHERAESGEEVEPPQERRRRRPSDDGDAARRRA
ncbi:AAA family ATPase [Knoellia locipacati]|uniref:ATP-binding protein n=1 Tax=Knoellia locipacati TaxID=882824 RepID=UPI00384CB460